MEPDLTNFQAVRGIFLQNKRITAVALVTACVGVALALFIDPALFIPARFEPHIRERLLRYYFGFSDFLIVAPALFLMWRFSSERLREGLNCAFANRFFPPLVLVASVLLLHSLDVYEWYQLSLFLFYVFLLAFLYPFIRIFQRSGTDIEYAAGFLSAVCFFFVAGAYAASIGMTVRWLPAIFLIFYAVAFAFSLKGETTTASLKRRNKLLIYPIALVVFFSALSCIYYGYMVAPPDADITSQAQLATWYKMGFSANAVTPYSNSVVVGINYPAGLYSLTAVLSSVLDVDINFILLWLWLASILCLALSIYLLVYEIFKKRFWAFCSVLIFGGSEIYDLFNGGQVQELYSTAFGCLLLREIFIGFKDRKSIFLGGMYFAGMMLTQTEVAYPFSIAVLALLFVVERGAPLRNFILAGFFTLFLVLPWVLGLAGGWRDAPTMEFSWVYSLFSNTFWGTKTWAYAGMVGIGMAWAIFHLRRRMIPLFILLGASIFLSQYHHLYALLKVKGYTIYQKDNLPFGAMAVYSDQYLSFITQWDIVWVCFIISLGVFSAFVAPATFRVLSFLPITRHKRKILMLGMFVVLAFYFRVVVTPFSSLIHPADYRALKWLKEHHPANDTLVYSESLGVPGTNASMAYWWVGAISEKPNNGARITSHEVRVIKGELAVPQLPSSGNIADPARQGNIGYIFISSRHPDIIARLDSYKAAGFKLIYDHEGALIFKTGMVSGR